MALPELSPIQDNMPRAGHVLERAKPLEEIILIRCPSCKGLRGVARRHMDRYSGKCKECRHGKVVPRWTFCSFWVERFTMKEIDEMARAIWG